MSATSGPDIVSDSLVFYYDTGNSRDSYKGEPTENIVTNPTFLGTSGTQTSAISQNWYFSGYDGDTGFKFHNSSTSPIPLKFPNEGAVITTGPNGSTNRRIYYNSTVEPNTTYTLSYWLYSSAYGSISNYFFIYQADGTDAGSTSYGQGITTGEWVFIKQSFTTPSITSNTRNVYWGPVISFNTDSLFAMQRFQIEAKAHATPFTIGTRSSTQGLLDISGQGNSIDISNASFDSNAQMTFDGTDDRVTLIGPVHSRTLSSATEVVFKVNSLPSSNYAMIFGYRHTGGNYSSFVTGPIVLRSDGKIYSSVITSTEVYRAIYSTTTIQTGKHYHVILNKDAVNGILELYLNGILESTQTFDADNYPSWANGTPGSDYLEIGGLDTTYSWSKFLNGIVPVGKLYSNVLTASEVKQNYDSIKTRFGLT